MVRSAKEITIIPALNKTQPIRTAVYARVSTKSPEQLTSYLMQIEYYKSLIENDQNATLVDIYAEQQSGRDAANRDEFQRLIRDARAGKLDRILIKSAARFARNITDHLQYLRELKALGVSVFFEEEAIDTGHMSSELMISLFGVFAQERSRELSENMRMSVRKRMADGKFIGSYLAYGYIRNPKTKEIEINELEANIVRLIFKLRLEGFGSQLITDILNNLKIRSRSGKRWSHRSIVYILKNERYIGDALLIKKIRTDETFPPKRVKNNGLEEQYYIENNHPPIITKEDFNQVQILLNTNEKDFQIKIYPLSKKIKCIRCGHFYRRTTNSEKIYWACSFKKQSSNLCDSPYILESDIYSAFAHLVNKLYECQENIFAPIVEQLEYLVDSTGEYREQVVSLDNKLADLGDKIKVITELKNEGLIEPGEYLIQSQRLNDEGARLRSERLALIRKNEKASTLEETRLLYGILKNIEYPQKIFDQNLFDSIVTQIQAGDKDSVTFTLIGGAKFSEPIKRGK